MSNLQTYCHFKLDFQKVDQDTGGHLQNQNYLATESLHDHNERNGHINRNKSHNHHDENHDEI